jgi:hypothetical protein
MVDGSFSYSAASAQVLRNGSAITSSTRIYPGDRLQLRLRAPSSGSGEMRYRMYVIENGGLGTPIGSRWTVSYQGSSTDSSFGSGSYFSGGSSSFFGSGSSFGGSFFGP